MIKTFIFSFKLKIMYLVNSIIYSLTKLPIIGKRLPSKTLYKSSGVKIFAYIIAGILELFGMFIGKILYIFLMIYSALSMYKTNEVDTFIHIIFFLSIIGGMLNTYMFNPSIDKYYGIFVMKLDAKEYVISNYIYSILKVVIGFLPVLCIISIFLKINIIYSILITLFIASIKLVFAAFFLHLYKKKGIIVNENKPIKNIWIYVAILLATSYAMPYIGIVITSNLFIPISILFIILGIYSIRYIFKFDKYREIYKKLLDFSQINVVNNANEIVKDNMQKKIEISEKTISNKSGYAYFNDLFIKRHKSILMSPVKKITAFCLFAVLATIIISIVNEQIKQPINKIMLNFLPYFVFVMYIINRGQIITQAMFMNCDHSMLTYSFYRSPKAILGLFKERLKSLIIINLIPAFVIGTGLALILFATGGTDNILNYIVLIVSIIAMSIFFSVHYLVIYYLLQPYNYNSEIKDSRYQIVNFITYIVCYFTLKLQLPTMYFGLFTVCFSVIYCILSLFLAYKLAPKTFKIKI